MKKIGLIILGFMILAISGLSTYAQDDPKDPVFRIATGGEKGVYYSIAAKEIEKQLGSVMYTHRLITKGSEENLELLAKGEAEGAIVQFDALLTNQADVVVVGKLHPEFAYLLVKKDSKIKSVKDLNKNTKVAVGPIGSGIRVTWNGFCSQDASYKEVPTQPLAGSRALSELTSGGVDAVLMVGGLKMGDVVRADKAGDYKLIPVDDWDFNNAKFKGESIYKFTKIDSKAYPNLISGFFGGSVETLEIPSIFVVSAKWADEHPREFDKLFDATTAAVPNILNAVKPKD